MIQQSHYDQGYQARKNGDSRAIEEAVINLPPHQYLEFMRGFDAYQDSQECVALALTKIIRSLSNGRIS